MGDTMEYCICKIQGVYHGFQVGIKDAIPSMTGTSYLYT